MIINNIYSVQSFNVALCKCIMIKFTHFQLHLSSNYDFPKQHCKHTAYGHHVNVCQWLFAHRCKCARCHFKLIRSMRWSTIAWKPIWNIWNENTLTSGIKCVLYLTKVVLQIIFGLSCINIALLDTFMCVSNRSIDMDFYLHRFKKIIIAFIMIYVVDINDIEHVFLSLSFSFDNFFNAQTTFSFTHKPKKKKSHRAVRAKKI